VGFFRKLTRVDVVDDFKQSKFQSSTQLDQSYLISYTLDIRLNQNFPDSLSFIDSLTIQRKAEKDFAASASVVWIAEDKKKIPLDDEHFKPVVFEFLRDDRGRVLSVIILLALKSLFDSLRNRIQRKTRTEDQDLEGLLFKSELMKLSYLGRLGDMDINLNKLVYNVKAFAKAGQEKYRYKEPIPIVTRFLLSENEIYNLICWRGGTKVDKDRNEMDETVWALNVDPKNIHLISPIGQRVPDQLAFETLSSFFPEEALLTVSELKKYASKVEAGVPLRSKVPDGFPSRIGIWEKKEREKHLQRTKKMLEYESPKCPEIVDFSSVFEKHPKEQFVGREDTLAAIDKFVKVTKTVSNYLLIIGEAGVGKTALMANCLKDQRNQTIHYFVERKKEELDSPTKFFKHLYFALSHKYQLSFDCDEDNIETIIEKLKRRIREICETQLFGEEKEVIFVDGLDEATATTKIESSIVDLLHLDLPENFRMVLFTRDISELKRFILPNKDNVIYLTGKSQESRAAIADYLGKNLSEYIHSPAVVNTLIKRSEGNFLYAKLLVDTIRRERGKIDQLLRDPPQGLFGLYDFKMQQLRQRIKNQKTLSKVWKVLRIISILQEPHTIQEIFDYLHIDYLEHDQIFGLLQQFLDLSMFQKEGKCRWFHTSFDEYVISPQRLSKKELVGIHGLIVRHCRNIIESGEETTAMKYGLKFLPKHYLCSESYYSMINFMKHHFIPAKIKASKSYSTIIADLESVIGACEKINDLPNAILFSLLLSCIREGTRVVTEINLIPLLALLNRVDEAEEILTYIGDPGKKLLGISGLIRFFHEEGNQEKRKSLCRTFIEILNHEQFDIEIRDLREIIKWIGKVDREAVKLALKKVKHPDIADKQLIPLLYLEQFPDNKSILEEMDGFDMPDEELELEALHAYARGLIDKDLQSGLGFLESLYRTGRDKTFLIPFFLNSILCRIPTDDLKELVNVLNRIFRLYSEFEKFTLIRLYNWFLSLKRASLTKLAESSEDAESPKLKSLILLAAVEAFSRQKIDELMVLVHKIPLAKYRIAALRKISECHREPYFLKTAIKQAQEVFPFSEEYDFDEGSPLEDYIAMVETLPTEVRGEYLKSLKEVITKCSCPNRKARALSRLNQFAFDLSIDLILEEKEIDKRAKYLENITAFVPHGSKRLLTKERNRITRSIETTLDQLNSSELSADSKNLAIRNCMRALARVHPARALEIFGWGIQKSDKIEIVEVLAESAYTKGDFSDALRNSVLEKARELDTTYGPKENILPRTMVAISKHNFTKALDLVCQVIDPSRREISYRLIAKSLSHINFEYALSASMLATNNKERLVEQIIEDILLPEDPLVKHSSQRFEYLERGLIKLCQSEKVDPSLKRKVSDHVLSEIARYDPGIAEELNRKCRIRNNGLFYGPAYPLVYESTFSLIFERLCKRTPKKAFDLISKERIRGRYFGDALAIFSRCLITDTKKRDIELAEKLTFLFKRETLLGLWETGRHDLERSLLYGAINKAPERMQKTVVNLKDQNLKREATYRLLASIARKDFHSCLGLLESLKLDQTSKDEAFRRIVEATPMHHENYKFLLKYFQQNRDKFALHSDEILGLLTIGLLKDDLEMSLNLIEQISNPFLRATTIRTAQEVAQDFSPKRLDEICENLADMVKRDTTLVKHHLEWILMSPRGACFGNSKQTRKTLIDMYLDLLDNQYKGKKEFSYRNIVLALLDIDISKAIKVLSKISDHHKPDLIAKLARVNYSFFIQHLEKLADKSKHVHPTLRERAITAMLLEVGDEIGLHKLKQLNRKMVVSEFHIGKEPLEYIARRIARKNFMKAYRLLKKSGTRGLFYLPSILALLPARNKEKYFELLIGDLRTLKTMKENEFHFPIRTDYSMELVGALAVHFPKKIIHHVIKEFHGLEKAQAIYEIITHAKRMTKQELKKIIETALESLIEGGMIHMDKSFSEQLVKLIKYLIENDIGCLDYNLIKRASVNTGAFCEIIQLLSEKSIIPFLGNEKSLNSLFSSLQLVDSSLSQNL
jgi:hypothetical protein